MPLTALERCCEIEEVAIEGLVESFRIRREVVPSLIPNVRKEVAIWVGRGFG